MTTTPLKVQDEVTSDCSSSKGTGGGDQRLNHSTLNQQQGEATTTHLGPSLFGVTLGSEVMGCVCVCMCICVYVCVCVCVCVCV